MEERGHAFSAPSVPISSRTGQGRYEHPATHTVSSPSRDALHHQQQQQKQPQQQQVIVIEAPRQKTHFSRLYYEFTVVVGLVEIITGLFSIALGIANPVQCGYFGVIGYGIWGGAIYIISGAIAILAKRKKKTCLVITHLTMSIIAAMVASVQFCLGVIAASKDNEQTTLEGRKCFYDTLYYLPTQPVSDPRGRVVVDALLAAVAIIQATAAILDSAFTCKGLCCPPKFSAAAAAAAGLPITHGGNVHCVPGHVLCSASDGHISRGTRAVINGVITFQGQDETGLIGEQWMLHQAPSYSQVMRINTAAAATARMASENRGRHE